MTQGLGRPYLNHQFASAAHFEHVILFVFKSEYSNKDGISALCRTHPLIEHLWVSYNRLKNFDFTSLSLYNTSFKKQQQIPFSRIMKFTATALHHNFHIPSVIMYIGNNYTDAFRDVKKVLNRVKDIAPLQICKDLERIFKMSAPRYMVAESSRVNFLTYWRYGNHRSLLNNLKKSIKFSTKRNGTAMSFHSLAGLSTLWQIFTAHPQGS